MIRHIVLFRFIDKEKELDVARKKLESIFRKAVGCTEWYLAENVTPRPTGYDLVLSGTFESVELLRAYENCDEHQAFVSYIGPVTSAIAEADFPV